MHEVQVKKARIMREHGRVEQDKEDWFCSIRRMSKEVFKYVNFH